MIERIIANNSKIMIITKFVCLVFLMIMIIPTIFASSYSVHQSDDYNDANIIISCSASYSNQLEMVIKQTQNEYMTKQGTWLVAFFRPLLMPLCNNGLVSLKLVQVIFSTFILFSFVVMCFLIFKIILGYSKFLSLIGCTLMTYMFMSYRVYYEVFYWYTGMIGYGLPLVLSFLSFIMVMLYIYYKRTAFFGFACILGFVSTGGTLGQVGFVCYVSLIALVFKLMVCDNCSTIKQNLFNKKNYDVIVFFAIMLIGALINVLAPGNYVRLDAEMNIPLAIKNTLIVLSQEYSWLLHDTNILIILLILFLIGLLGKSGIISNDYRFVCVSFLGVFTPAVCIFPVVLGYSMPYVANRGIVIVNIAIYVSLTFICLVLGHLVRSIFTNSEVKVFGAVTIMIIFIISLSSDYSLYNMSFYRTSCNLLNGSISHYYEDCCDFFEYLSENKGKVLVIESYPEGLQDFSNFYLENGWVNDAVAEYYGIKTLLYNKN